MYVDLPPPLDVARIVAPYDSSMPLDGPKWQEFLGAREAADFIDSVGWLEDGLPVATTPVNTPRSMGSYFVIEGGASVVIAAEAAPVQSYADKEGVVARTLPHQLDLIKERLDISVTQLAELFSVTRKTVYDWYEGQSPRNAKNGRINALAEALDEAHDVDLKRLKGFWDIALSGGSFRSTLQSDTLSGPELTAALLAKLNELSAEMSATNRSPRRGLSSHSGESTLADIERRSDSY